MGQIHNELTRGPWSRALKNALGITKGEGGLERYGETLTPVVDLWSLPEWAFLRGERLVQQARGGPAVAAEFGAVALLNPTGSNALIVVEEATLDPGALAGAAVMQLSIVNETVILATLATTSFGIGRDSRFIGPGVTIGVTVAGSDPATIGSIAESVRVPAGNMPISRSVPWVLGPGFGLVMMLATVNTAFNANFTWRERRALIGEL